MGNFFRQCLAQIRDHLQMMIAHGAAVNAMRWYTRRDRGMHHRHPRVSAIALIAGGAALLPAFSQHQ
jgi:hypothetical protein